MQARIGRSAIALAAVLMLAACGDKGEPQLMNLRSATQGPDEFGILPTKALQMPADLAALPEPTPGGSNLTDPTPMADAVAALGGNPARVALAGALPAADAGLVAHAGRFGTAGDIRSQLATEDVAYRRENDGRLLERIFDVNTYYRAYAPMSLDQQAELERWRRAGLRTPAAPPDPRLD